MFGNVVEVRGEVSVVDRHSLYSAKHEYILYYLVGAEPSSSIPFNVWCDKCKMKCAVDMVQRPGFTKFWCTGKFLPSSNSLFTRDCGFSLTFSNQ